MRNGDTLRNWVQRDRVDAGELPGTTSADATRISELERRFVSCGARTRSFPYVGDRRVFPERVREWVESACDGIDRGGRDGWDGLVHCPMTGSPGARTPAALKARRAGMVGFICQFSDFDGWRARLGQLATRSAH